MRILHLPLDLGGHARALAAAQRAEGHAAVSVSLDWSPLGFNGDEARGLPLGAPGWLRRRETERWRLLWRGLREADVIHCHFGRTLGSVMAFPQLESGGGFRHALVRAYARALWLRDLPVWRRAGKRVAMTFYGDDVRPVALSLARNPHTHLAIPALRAELEPRDAAKRALVAALERHGVAMFATNPDLLAAVPAARFLAYGHVDPAGHQPRPPRAAGPLRLLHMPTNRAVKGSDLFIAAVERLRAEGLAAELTLVEGRSNAEALAILAEHDVLLDQLRVGWFGGVAVEAMAMGKPVVCYLNPADEALAPAEYRAALPLIRADPTDVEAVLRRLLGMPREALREQGLAARRFVEAWHDPRAVARQVLAAYG
jgi:glycosyltransferase involved in cell wall biosynthesis